MAEKQENPLTAATQKRAEGFTGQMFRAIGDQLGGAWLKECYGVYKDAAEPKQDGDKWNAMAGVVAVFSHLQKDQPSFAAEMMAEFRHFREEVFANLLVAFPGSLQLSREIGAPGTPTQAEVFHGRTGNDLPYAEEIGNDQQQQQSRGRSR